MTSLFRTQTSLPESLSAPTSSPITKRTSDDEEYKRDGIGAAWHNHKHSHQHEARDTCAKNTWLFNNCNPVVSKGQSLDVGKYNGALLNNCGQISCDELTAIRWCNYIDQEQQPTWEDIIEGARRILIDLEFTMGGNITVVREVVFSGGWSVQVTGVNVCK